VRTRSHKDNKVNVITLGCSKNMVDSEVLMHQLRANEFEVTHQDAHTGSDIVIINTCGFIDRAKEESVNTILEYAAAKQEGNLKKLYVTGCLSQRYRDDLTKEIPEVDAWFGTLELPALLQKLNADYRHDLIGERSLLTPPHYAYLKISEGCNRTCSFCAIPLMRGGHVSKPMEHIVQEAKNLVRDGVKEVMLIAQELTYYGLDIYKKRSLDTLLHQLADVEGLEWIRLHYAYPSKFPLEVLDVMQQRPNICNYLDIPLQHASDPVLERMRRQITLAETEQLLDTVRQKVPGIAIRTTMLVGFPGETEQDFDTLCQFVERQRFDRLGVFTYSHEENTRGYEYEDDVPAETKETRAAELMDVQQGISWEINQQKVGRQFRVLFDRVEGGYFVGRTEFDSPEVDNEVLVPVEGNFARIGDFATVEITDAEEFDLYGKVVA
jgi:ribosomal protein S12 methylthiotransferase